MATANTYRLVKVGTFKGQCGQVQAAIQRVGRDFRVADVVPELESDPTFTTTQTPERIAAYYVCVLKKSGHLIAVDATAPRTLESVSEELDRVEARRLELIDELAKLDGLGVIDNG